MGFSHEIEKGLKLKKLFFSIEVLINQKLMVAFDLNALEIRFIIINLYRIDRAL